MTFSIDKKLVYDFEEHLNPLNIGDSSVKAERTGS